MCRNSEPMNSTIKAPGSHVIAIRFSNWRRIVAHQPALVR